MHAYSQQYCNYHTRLMLWGILGWGEERTRDENEGGRGVEGGRGGEGMRVREGG